MPDLELILEAAGRAPSARNGQPWHFLVLRDPAAKKELQKIFEADWWDRRAQAGILTFEDVPEGDRPTVAFLERLAETPVIVLACMTSDRIANEVLAAAQNLLLAARGLGIGGTFMRFGPSPAASTLSALCEAFGLPEGARVEYVVPLGYPVTAFGAVQRKSLAEIASLDRWGRAL
jgi:nitroreductase